MEESCKVKRTDVSKTYSNTLPKYLKHTCCHLLCKSLSDCGQLSGVIKITADDKLFETKINTSSGNDTRQHISLSDCGHWTRVIKPTLDDKLVGTRLKSSNDTRRHKTAINVIVDKLFEPRKFFKMKGYNCVWHLLFILLCLVQIKRNIYNSVTLSDKMLCEDWNTPMVQNTEKINKTYLLSDLFKLRVFRQMCRSHYHLPIDNITPNSMNLFLIIRCPKKCWDFFLWGIFQSI
jgi:hypothetical protein